MKAKILQQRLGQITETNAFTFLRSPKLPILSNLPILPKLPMFTQMESITFCQHCESWSSFAESAVFVIACIFGQVEKLKSRNLQMGRLLVRYSKAFSRWMIHGPSTAAHRAITPGFQWVFVTLHPPRFSFLY